MREILFRGKRTDNGAWVNGDLLNACVIRDTGIAVGTVDMSCECEVQCRGFRVIPETIGQYTGLKDKKGVKIFEGDVVEHYGEIFSVEFENGLFVVKGQSYRIDPSGNEHRIRDDLLCNDRDVYEVIGNIHDQGDENG